MPSANCKAISQITKQKSATRRYLQISIDDEERWSRRYDPLSIVKIPYVGDYAGA